MLLKRYNGCFMLGTLSSGTTDLCRVRTDKNVFSLLRDLQACLLGMELVLIPEFSAVLEMILEEMPA